MLSALMTKQEVKNMKQATKRHWPEARGGRFRPVCSDAIQTDAARLKCKSALWLGLALLMCSGATWAGAVLDSARSDIQFVSVKNGGVGEVHHFPKLSGSIGKNGAVTVDIPLAAVETQIPIRNERMADMLFEVASFPVATLTAQVDLAALKAMGKGDYTEIDLSFELSLHGKTGKLSASLGVTRLDEGVRAATLRPVIVNAASFGLTEGVERLRAVVGLSSIATAVPVTAQLVFLFGE